MKNLFAYSLLVVILFSACTHESVKKGIIDIGNAYEKRTPVMASEYFSSIEYIPLETSEGSMLEDVTHMVVALAEDRLVIHNYNTPDIKAFDYSGKILEFKARKGRTKKEFMSVRGLFTYNDEVMVVGDDNILIYDMDGNFKERIDTPTCNFVFNVPFIINERLFGVLGNDIIEKKLCIDHIDGTGKRIYGDPVYSYSGNAYKPRYITRNGVNYELMQKLPGIIYNANEKVFLMLKANDTLYTISKETCQKSPEYIFDYGKYLDEKSNKRILFLLETPKFLIASVLFNKILYNPPAGYIMPPFVYDYDTGQTRILPYYEEFDRNGFENDVNGDELIFYPKLCRGNKMYELINAIDFIDIAEKSKSSKIKEVAAKLTEESNPVLVVGTLKN